jgi:hypothetical protein
MAEMVELTGSACRGGSLAVMQLLLDSGGVDVNSVLEVGVSFLIRAARYSPSLTMQKPSFAQSYKSKTTSKTTYFEKKSGGTESVNPWYLSIGVQL